MKNVYLLAFALLFSFSVVSQNSYGDSSSADVNDNPGSVTVFPPDGSGDTSPNGCNCSKNTVGGAIDDGTAMTANGDAAGTGSTGSARRAN